MLQILANISSILMFIMVTTYFIMNMRKNKKTKTKLDTTINYEVITDKKDIPEGAQIVNLSGNNGMTVALSSPSGMKKITFYKVTYDTSWDIVEQTQVSELLNINDLDKIFINMTKPTFFSDVYIEVEHKDFSKVGFVFSKGADEQSLQKVNLQNKKNIKTMFYYWFN